MPASSRRSKRPAPLALAALTGALVAGCLPLGNDRVLGISGTGIAKGFVYFDRNGSRTFDAGDTALANVRVIVVPKGTIDSSRSRLTDQNGNFLLRDLPIGAYQIAIDTTGVAGDSLGVTRITRDTFTLQPGDTASLQAAFSFPQVSVTQLRALPLNKKVFIAGVALSSISAILPGGTFGDSTVHLADPTGAIRMTALRNATIGQGDSLRALGTRSSRDGRPSFDRPTSFVQANNAAQPITTVTSAVAAAADTGELDAGLVQVLNATTLDTATVPDGFRLTVSDASGPLQVLLDSEAFTSAFPTGVGILGNVFTYKGLLVPPLGGGATWQLKPRGTADVSGAVPTMTIAQARSQPAGTKVFIIGLALTDVSTAVPGGTFGDSTLHIDDKSAAIRLIGAKGNVTVSDSIRIFGVLGSRTSQPVLTQPTIVSLFGVGNVAAHLIGLSTAQSASANGGLADAALVRVLNAVVLDTASVAGAFRVHVSDNSGPVEVRLDSVTFGGGFPAKIDSVGAKFDITGVLVPVGGNVWRIQPRSVSDFLKKP